MITGSPGLSPGTEQSDPVSQVWVATAAHSPLISAWEDKKRKSIESNKNAAVTEREYVSEGVCPSKVMRIL